MHERAPGIGLLARDGPSGARDGVAVRRRVGARLLHPRVKRGRKRGSGGGYVAALRGGEHL